MKPGVAPGSTVAEIERLEERRLQIREAGLAAVFPVDEEASEGSRRGAGRHGFSLSASRMSWRWMRTSKERAIAMLAGG
ncbi:hypothetical protein GCM10017600_04910 [Streptosporangium carneum]|uniref:Uncharacterized protein n=1 Tax=Streptosporangium carneum TaxID=47481 RepID=A0A9W6HWI0_9ACTN|nr:hypothetical protein GCM10017600_04910 [Streptosporangium carneum]